MKMDRVVFCGCFGLFAAGGIFFQIFDKTMNAEILTLILSFFSAVGTVGAVAVAMLLSQRTENRINKSELVIAELEAARVSPLLESLLRELDSAQASFMFNDGNEVSQDLLEKLLFLGRLASSIAHESLVRMACLEENCAHRIARGLSCIQNNVALVDRIKAVGWVNVPHMQKIFWFGQLNSSINDARDLLMVASRICHRTSNKGAPLPTGEEKYGNHLELDHLE
ncbi:hypothetical protein CLU80_0039 [Pseudomonas sp. 29]|uniref:hypothetical protein n=1 Tax=Pseudomonas sp. 29 TaxID=2035197 RepID=UPI000C1759AD|nr:hypothetical protein [Pseudomonas sp. 29]PIF47819.1 hypothetical protein CLU80_0039 [Pseudomonas sp. 29]